MFISIFRNLNGQNHVVGNRAEPTSLKSFISNPSSGNDCVREEWRSLQETTNKQTQNECHTNGNGNVGQKKVLKQSGIENARPDVNFENVRK